MNATYKDGVATIITRATTSQVHVAATAALVLDGQLGRPEKTDMLALACGYVAMKAERDRLQEELVAARAGSIGKEHAQAMQGARTVISKLFQAATTCKTAWDNGDATTIQQDKEFQDAIDSADTWLIGDVSAASDRAKMLKGGDA